ncbi:TPA: hypothetical protein ACXN3T_001254 [Proteus mirabilis]
MSKDIKDGNYPEYINTKSYTNEQAKKYLARLQSILTRENNEKELEAIGLRAPHNKWLGKTESIVSLMGAAGSLFGVLPKNNKDQKQISVNIKNNSECIFSPTFVQLDKSYSAQENLDVCGPGESTSLRIVHPKNYTKDDNYIFIQFLMSDRNNQKIKCELKIGNDGDLWKVLHIGFWHKHNAIYERPALSNPTNSELELFTVESVDFPKISFGIAVFSTPSKFETSSINIMLVPFHAEARNFALAFEGAKKSEVDIYSSESVAHSLATNYWDHVDRLNGNDDKSKLFTELSFASSVISGAISIFGGAKRLKKHTAPGKIDISINNYTAFSLVIYKIIRGGGLDISDIVIPSGKKGTLTMEELNLNKDNGPEFYICIDGGENSSSIMIELARFKTGDKNAIEQIHINKLIFDNVELAHSFDSKKLITPAFHCQGTGEVKFIMTSPPTNSPDCNISINFFDDQLMKD